MLNKAYINLNLLKNNALAVKEKLNKGVKFCAVVKADAYGHGASVCANALYPIVDCFAVALVEEGVALRQSGVKKDILVLIPPFISDLPSAVHYNLTLTVSSVLDVLRAQRESQKQNRRTKLHVKVNTGMNRQGVDSLDELISVVKEIAKSKNLILDGVFSHFACPEEEKARNNALNKFLLANKTVKGYNNKVIAHLSASGGFLSGVQMDMVRIGILLYGYKPFESSLLSVKPIMSVEAPVIKRFNLKAGESALYGDCRAKKDVDLSLVRFGYADGLFRERTNRQFNNRCMDLTAVKDCDLDYFPILSNEFDADVVAREYGTISYEILCRASARAEKIYIR
ncbi:MAG: alanine racemase [Clostridiales bacterium]|nr:alanine racemase [Clostridiales bacterium]